MSKDLQKKCIAVHIPVNLLEKINENKAKTGKSQNNSIVELIEKGLDIFGKEEESHNYVFFVIVRINISKMIEFGQKLQNGEIDTSHIILTFCKKDDPTVGMSFWKAESREQFDDVFAQHRPFYNDVLEITPVITPMDSMKLIMLEMK